MNIELACGLDLGQAVDLYKRYDDHRFAFVTTAPVGVSEVAAPTNVSSVWPRASRESCG